MPVMMSARLTVFDATMCGVAESGIGPDAASLPASVLPGGSVASICGCRFWTFPHASDETTNSNLVVQDITILLGHDKVAASSSSSYSVATGTLSDGAGL